jgi:hypothetical protein
MSGARRTTPNVFESGNVTAVFDDVNVAAFEVPTPAISENSRVGLALGTDGTTQGVTTGPTIDFLSALLAEVDLRSQVTTRTDSLAGIAGVGVDGATQTTASVTASSTSGYIDFTPDPADLNGDGTVTVAEQLLYDAMH